MEKSEKKPIYISCIFCNRELEYNEVFIAHMKKDGMITIAECLNCSPLHKNGERKEKKGEGWLILKRNYNHYEAQKTT